MLTMKPHLMLSICFLVPALTAAAIRADEGSWQEPVDVAFIARYDGSTQHYVVMLPKGFDSRKPVDLLVALHGHGSDRWQFVRDGRDECRALRDAAARLGMIYLAPDYRAPTSWMGPAAEVDMLQILDAIRKKYSIRHTFVGGGSMGGSAALTFAALYPDRVDGVVSLNGTANHVEYRGFQEAIARSFGGTKAEVPEEYKRRSAEVQLVRLTMPIAATVGGRDTSVPPDSVRRLARELQKRGRSVLLIDRNDGGHSTSYADTTAATIFVVEKVRSQDHRRAILLPDYCNTPDAMAVLADGSLILSVPNFTDPTSPGVLMKISPQDEVSLFCKLPLHPETKHVYPMGVRQAPSGDLYVADCQFMDGKPDRSRLLCVRVANGKPGAVEVVAQGLSIANGVAIRDGFVYLTDSSTGKTAEGAVVSTIYRFRLDERDVQIQPGGRDRHQVTTQKTVCKEIPVGADGIDFDELGNLYVANCGDAVIDKIVLDQAGKVVSQKVLTAPGAMKSADGMFYDYRTRRLLVADILANAIRAVTLDGQVETLASDGDNDGSGGRLDGPSEVVVRGNELVAANFDRVFPGSVNTKPDKPYTLAVIPYKAPANKSAQVPANYNVQTDIFYLPNEESQASEYERTMCRLDVYYPKDKPGFATLVWIHGGGLYTGSRKLEGPMKDCPAKLMEHGVAIVSIDYRLHPKVSCPTYLQDAAAGVAWAFHNIQKYGGDPNKVFVGGGSGGAYLASMLGFDKRWLHECGADANQIKGLLPVSGHTITHFTIRKERGIPQNQLVVDEFAPLWHVRSDAPPVLLITGDRELEMLGRYEENAYFARMLKVAGHKNVKLIEFKGCNHTTCNNFADVPMWEWMQKLLAP